MLGLQAIPAGSPTVLPARLSQRGLRPGCRPKSRLPVMGVFALTESASTATGDIRTIVTVESSPSISESTWVAPGAHVIGNVILGHRSSVWFNSVLRADGDKITIGADTNIQDLALCHVDPGKPLTIGARVTVGHGAILRGCTIEDDVLIGAGWLEFAQPHPQTTLIRPASLGTPIALLTSSCASCFACRASVMHGARIGRGSTVAAGADVLEHFHAPPYSLIVGSPATVKADYTDKAACLARAAKQAHQYSARASAYRRSLREMLDQPEGAECRQWEPVAWNEAAARLGYPRLLDDDIDEAAGGQAYELAQAREVGPAPVQNGLDAPGLRAGAGGGGGGVANIGVAALAGAMASIILTALRRGAR